MSKYTDLKSSTKIVEKKDV